MIVLAGVGGSKTTTSIALSTWSWLMMAMGILMDSILDVRIMAAGLLPERDTASATMGSHAQSVMVARVTLGCGHRRATHHFHGC